MYEKRFGLARRPFPATPDADRYYPATGHEAAVTTLARGLEDDEGLLLLTGTAGTGKTLLGQVLLDRVGDQRVTALLTNSHLPDRCALFQAILYDLGLPYAERGEQLLRLRLTDQLLKTCADGRRTLLVLDEAHHLSADLLEELRLLANLEAGSRRALQVVLIAQPAILGTLGQPGLESLQQRLAVRCQVEPLGVEEACDYLLHHLRQVGGQPEKVFDDAGLEVLARGTGGLPRRLNQAAHQALLLADAAELTCVDAEAALEALAVLGLSAGEGEADGEPVAGSIEAFEVGQREPPAGDGRRRTA
jgi:general secretion pathway protein A